ncbi:MAG TPA: hypothetical protein ENH59_04800 [Bacteroidetes bacterium]|nr:hypothetical protein [Bacteroidota bacterium]
MKRWKVLIFFLPVLFSQCKEDVGIDYFTAEKAEYYFSEVKKLCDRDDGKLWGENLYGPILLIDTETRKLYSNVQDSEGILKPRGNIFTGTYPREEVINYAKELGGTLYAMAPIPEEEDYYRITSRCIHGLSHCLQIRKDIDTPDYNTSHMGERTARLWLKMEWKALERAIRTNGDTRGQAVRDALVFRSARRELYPKYIQDENKFENYEGLASFTYMMLCSETRDEYLKKLLEYYHRIYDFRSYTFSYGFVHGNIYAHLLNETGFDFSTINSRDFDLGEALRDRYEIILPEISRDIAGSLSFSYDVDLVKEEEREREEQLREGLRRRTAQFTEKPVVLLELESPNFSFEAEDTDPVDTLGTIYQTIRVTDNWGKLAVEEGGCLVSPNLRFLRVPAKNVEQDKQHISGYGWHIVLNNNWEMVKLEENYFIRKLTP